MLNVNRVSLYMIPIPAVPGDRRWMETRAVALSVPTY